MIVVFESLEKAREMSVFEAVKEELNSIGIDSSIIREDTVHFEGNEVEDAIKAITERISVEKKDSVVLCFGYMGLLCAVEAQNDYQMQRRGTLPEPDMVVCLGESKDNRIESIKRYYTTQWVVEYDANKTDALLAEEIVEDFLRIANRDS